MWVASLTRRGLRVRSPPEDSGSDPKSSTSTGSASHRPKPAIDESKGAQAKEFLGVHGTIGNLMYQQLSVGSDERQKKLVRSHNSLSAQEKHLANYGFSDADWYRSVQANTHTYLNGQELSKQEYKDRLAHFHRQGEKFENLQASIKDAREGEEHLPGLLQALKDKHGNAIQSPRIRLRPERFHVRPAALRSKSLPPLYALRRPGQAIEEQQRAQSLWDVKSAHIDRQLTHTITDRKKRVSDAEAAGDVEKHADSSARAQNVAMTRSFSQALLTLKKSESGSEKYLRNFQRIPEREQISRARSTDVLSTEEKGPTRDMRRVTTGL